MLNLSDWLSTLASGRMVHSKGSGRTEAAQRLPPKGLGLGQILPRQPGNVVPVWGWAGQVRILMIDKASIPMQDFPHQDGQTPAIGQEVMMTPHKLPSRLFQPNQAAAHKRGLIQRKPLNAVRPQESRQALVERCLAAPIHFVPGQGDL